VTQRDEKPPLSLEVRDAVVLVTGAGGNIGTALCAAFVAAGAQVVATDIGSRPSSLHCAEWLTHDVTSESEWERVILEVTRGFGRLDCLIQNAGISLVSPIAETSLEQWRRVMSVNTESVLLGLKASIPHLRRAGEGRAGGSSVVICSSAAGLRGVEFNAAYCASKGAVTLLSRSAAREFAALRYPIRVNSIHPSGVETTMLNSIFARYAELGLAPSAEAAKNAGLANHPLHRLATAEEIAGAAVFLCSPAASYMTGAELLIDGGGFA
jgi:NAD(P)-dependent dehydrogenase (short-subunit alcohol dehydrogenase family)